MSAKLLQILALCATANAFCSQGTLYEPSLISGADIVAVIDVKNVERSEISTQLTTSRMEKRITSNAELQVYRGEAAVITPLKGCKKGDTLIIMSVACNTTSESDLPSIFVGRQLAFLKRSGSSTYSPTSWMSLRAIGDDDTASWPSHTGGGWTTQSLSSILERMKITLEKPTAEQ